MAQTPAVLETLRQLGRGELGRFRPALDRDLAALGIDADGDAAGIFDAGAAHELRIAHRDGAEDHALDAAVDPFLDGRHVADAAAELRRDGDSFEDRIDRIAR